MINYRQYMKKWFQITGVVLAFMVAGTTTAKAQDESSSDIYNQIASMEYKQWSFTPKWYYYNKYWGTVVDMPWPIPDIKGWIPGLGVHDSQGYVVPTLPYVPFYNLIGDNYVNQKWRQMFPLRTAAAAESNLQAVQTESEKDFWNDIQIKDLAVFTDRSTNLPVIGARSVTSDERDELSQHILDRLFQIRELGGEADTYKELVEELRMEYDVIHEEVDLIGGSHEHNANRLRSLQGCNNRLRKLSRKVDSAYKLISNMEDPAMKHLSTVNRRYRNFR